MLRRIAALAAALIAAAGLPAAGQPVLVAVAANFADAMAALEARFEQAHPYDLQIATGSTGKLYAQIRAGAPFEVLLAADQERPALLLQGGDAVAGSGFTYALGRLTLWSPDPGAFGEDGAEYLRRGGFDHLALANPALAPYGRAALEGLAALGLADALAGKLVMGENVGQAFSLVATGNAEAGLVALSLVLSPRNTGNGSRWDLPAGSYAPIRQDAVLLATGAGNPGARAFLDFLRGPEARALIASFGYDLPGPGD